MKVRVKTETELIESCGSNWANHRYYYWVDDMNYLHVIIVEVRPYVKEGVHKIIANSGKGDWLLYSDWFHVVDANNLYPQLNYPRTKEG